MNLGKSIRLALVHKDVNQVQLAAEMGVSRPYVSAIVKGRKIPSLAVVATIASILDYKVSELIALGEEVAA